MADLSSLVIRLSADVAQLQSDLGKANAIAQRNADQLRRTMQGAADGIKDSFTSIAGALGVAFSVDKLVEFGKRAIDTADQIGKMAQKVGVSAEQLSTLRVQAQLSNVELDQLQGGLAKLAKNAADAATGSKQQAAAFQAVGVAVKDATGNLRPMADILADVSGKFSTYKDSAAKTALAQELFGKSGAELIPLLNQLGTEGFGKAREEAEKYGAVISGDAAKASEEFNDNLTRLKLETEGFANSVVQQLLPGLNKLTGELVEAGQTTKAYGDTATVVANAIKGVAFAFDVLAQSVQAATGLIAGSANVMATVFSLPVKAGEALASGGLDGVKKAFGEAAISIRGAWDGASGGVTNAIDNIKKGFTALFGTFSNVTAASDTTAKAVGKVNAPLVQNAAAAEAAQKANEDYAAALIKAAQFQAQLEGKVDPTTKAYQEYVQAIIKAEQITQEIIDTATKAGKAEQGHALAAQFDAKAHDAASAALQRNLAALDRQADVLGRIQKEYADQAALIGLTDRERAIAEAIEKATDEFTKNTDAGIKNKQSLDEVQQGAASAAAAVYDLSERAKQSQDAAREFASIWEQAGNSIADAFAKAVVEGGSFLKSLADIAKQVVEQIISYFTKLAIINPILNSLFGSAMQAGGQGMLPTMGGGSGIIGSFLGAMGGGSTGNATFGTGQSGSISLFSAGKTMWEGFQQGWSNFFSGTNAYTMGPPTAAGSTSSFSPGYTSGFGQALGIAGGVYAGYNRYQQSAGGVAGVAGGAAYGVGTYYAGAAIAGALTTGSIAAGLAAIPVVGWIAIAAMLVDKFSGGKLFGTKGQFNFGQQALTVGPGGAVVTAGYDLKGQKPLFGGSTHSWQSMTPDQASVEAANAFFDQLTKGTQEFAKQFGKTMGDLVGGQFIQTFDKHGNVTATSSTVMGKTYNDTAEQFQTRLIAENELAVLGQFDSKLSEAIEKYRSNADQLNAVVQSLAQGQMMLNNGTKFLALGSDQSTSALLGLAEGVQQFGETIDQTVQRIEQAQAQYDQFVAQFKAPTNYVDDFEAALAGIHDQMLANIKQANALAQAAGAAGASEEDLANIHEYAARQAAAAIAALQSSAQSLAFQLGLTTTGSLDDVNAEIARLQQKAQSGAGAVGGLNSAISKFVDDAKAKMDLLLGDLSPLNDQQKLQTALAGLRAGTVTQDQVLQIGRRLYASSQAYTDLFNMVTNMGTGAHATATGGGVPTGGGLTGAERERLSALLKEQQQLQATQQLQQYQTLAQQIAEIAAAKGEDWRQVVTDMGINIADFEKGLKMTDDQTDAYIQKQQDMLDSNNENTKSIIDAINDMSDAIVTTLGGTPGAHSTHSTDTSNPDRTGATTTNPSHGGHMTPYQQGQEMQRGFRDGTMAQQPRSNRQRVPA